jgi:hypothetical protein
VAPRTPHARVRHLAEGRRSTTARARAWHLTVPPPVPYGRSEYKTQLDAIALPAASFARAAVLAYTPYCKTYLNSAAPRRS